MARIAVVRKNTAGGDDPRTGLREAIQTKQAQAAAVEEKQNAISRARTFIREIEGRIAEATIALNDAAEEHAAAVADAIAQNQKPPAPTSVKTARAKLCDNQDELVSAQAAARAIGGNLGEFEYEAAIAENEILVAIAEIMRPIGERLLRRAHKLKSELLIVHKALLEISAIEEQNVPDFMSDSEAKKAKGQRAAPLSELRAEVFKLTLEASSEEWRIAAEAAAPWRRARLALRSDPDVELPPNG